MIKGRCEVFLCFFRRIVFFSIHIQKADAFFYFHSNVFYFFYRWHDWRSFFFHGLNDVEWWKQCNFFWQETTFFSHVQKIKCFLFLGGVNSFLTFVLWQSSDKRMHTLWQRAFLRVERKGSSGVFLILGMCSSSWRVVLLFVLFTTIVCTNSSYAITYFGFFVLWLEKKFFDIFLFQWKGSFFLSSSCFMFSGLYQIRTYCPHHHDRSRWKVFLNHWFFIFRFFWRAPMMVFIVMHKRIKKP